MTTGVSDPVADGYVASGLRFFACDRCKKFSRCSDIVWGHKNQLIPMNGLRIIGADHCRNVELRLCPACMGEFDEVYREWWEKKL